MRQGSQKKKPTNRETKKELKRIDDEDEQAKEHAKGYGKNVWNFGWRIPKMLHKIRFKNVFSAGEQAKP